LVPVFDFPGSLPEQGTMKFLPSLALFLQILPYLFSFSFPPDSFSVKVWPPPAGRPSGFFGFFEALWSFSPTASGTQEVFFSFTFQRFFP